MRILRRVAAGPGGVTVPAVVDDGRVPVDGVTISASGFVVWYLSLNIHLGTPAAHADAKRQKQVHNQR